jgi:TetR/AcrR family transcriptional regulator
MTELSGCMTYLWLVACGREVGELAKANGRGAVNGRGVPRRAPEPERRQRDADRSRERILAAASEEFGAHGFAGARVASIAKRAGVNQQLISYYFGGKQGLYDALYEQWLEQEAVIAAPELPIGQVLAGYYDSVAANQTGARLLLWQALDDSPGGGTGDGRAGAGAGADSGAGRDDIEEAIADLRRRQEAGELTKEYDAEFIMLACWSTLMAPLTLPRVVRGAYHVDPWSAEFRDRFLPQVQRLFAASRETGS